MEPSQFDELTKALATATSRRQALRRARLRLVERDQLQILQQVDRLGRRVEQHGDPQAQRLVAALHDFVEARLDGRRHGALGLAHRQRDRQTLLRARAGVMPLC